MDGWKQYSLAGVMLVGTVVLIWLGKLPVDAWFESVAAVAGMIGLREFAAKWGASKTTGGVV